jgi:hypothetical protein
VIEPASRNGGGKASTRGAGLAFLAAAALCAFALRGGLFDSDAVLFGVDTATVQLPWSAVIDSEAPRGARNPELADQGVVFYPAYRWVIESWRRGDPPLWNPLLYAGAPALGNPQLGVLDPQVGLLAAIELAFGARARDQGLAWLAWARLVGAALGTWLLARALGLGPAGAALAAASFASSGFIVAWLNHSLGHVACFLPWVLLGLERLRAGPARRVSVWTAVVFAAAILGGHPETAFFIGAAAGVWCFTLPGRRRVLGLASLAAGTCLAAVSLAPFVEYVRRSGALIARRAAGGALEPDWLALGLLVIALGIWLRWRALAAHDRGAGSRALSSEWTGTLGFAAALVGIALLLSGRGWPPAARLALWPDLFGAPGKSAGGYTGSGSYLEQVSAWLPLVTLGLALAAILTLGRAAGGLAQRGWVSAIGLVAFLLSLRTPGVVELFGLLPGIGHGAVVRAAPVGALMLSLLAGEGLERSSRAARVGSAAALGALLACGLVHTPLPELRASARGGDAPEGLVAFTHVPAAHPETNRERLEGWVHPAVNVHTMRTRVERVDAAGAVIADSGFELPTELAPQPWPPGAAGTGAPEGARWFRSPFLRLEHLAQGHWRFSVDLIAPDGERLATRVAGTSSIERPPRPGAWTVSLVLLGLGALVLARPGVLGAGVWIALCVLQGLWFAEGKNPAVPRAECFPRTRTEAILARELGSRRYLSDPGVLPPNTGMVSGLPALDGYDGMDPDSFNGYRAYALQPGVQALLGWNARGVDLDSAAFRLFGVGMLALAAPMEHPGWELVAGPGRPEPAECWLYRATDPLPRAFCVPRAIPKAEVLADLAAFDPRATAFLEDCAWQAERPFARAEVRELEWSNNRVRLAADLDGDGLLVLTEQHFPGWRVEVDGERRELLRVDSIFRGVVLEAGQHELLFRYRPMSLDLGLALTLAAAGFLSVTALFGRLRRGQ